MASTGGCILPAMPIRGDEAVVEAVEAAVLAWAEAKDATSETSLSASLSVHTKGTSSMIAGVGIDEGRVGERNE